MNAFLEGFLSELSKEALLIPKGGLALGKQTVMKARNIPRSGDVHPGSARRELDMPKRPAAKPQAAPSKPATSNVPGVTPSASPARTWDPSHAGIFKAVRPAAPSAPAGKSWDPSHAGVFQAVKRAFVERLAQRGLKS